ncbi:MAG: hypothetical protein NWF01_04490 [Candidatus Bathyarchaeota archaeon]|nr:hypothetical protein [Candidatus Bathyarchaeota archaeon]
MLGKYDNFPVNLHFAESFLCMISSRQLQRKLVQKFCELNKQSFCFEEVANPTVPNSTLIFEFGLAENDGFNFLSEEETKKALTALKDSLRTMDFFCSIRYYKKNKGKRTPLKFDYYMMRLLFSKGEVEFNLFHERGLRYISPEDLVLFVVDKLNEDSTRKIIRRKQLDAGL